MVWTEDRERSGAIELIDRGQRTELRSRTDRVKDRGHKFAISDPAGEPKGSGRSVKIEVEDRVVK